MCNLLHFVGKMRHKNNILSLFDARHFIWTHNNAGSKRYYFHANTYSSSCIFFLHFAPTHVTCQVLVNVNIIAFILLLCCALTNCRHFCCDRRRQHERQKHFAFLILLHTLSYCFSRAISVANCRWDYTSFLIWISIFYRWCLDLRAISACRSANMLNIIHTCIHTHTYTYVYKVCKYLINIICVVVGAVAECCS